MHRSLEGLLRGGLPYSSDLLNQGGQAGPHLPRGGDQVIQEAEPVGRIDQHVDLAEVTRPMAMGGWEQRRPSLQGELRLQNAEWKVLAAQRQGRGIGCQALKTQWACWRGGWGSSRTGWEGSRGACGSTRAGWEGSRGGCGSSRAECGSLNGRLGRLGVGWKKDSIILRVHSATSSPFCEGGFLKPLRRTQTTKGGPDSQNRMGQDVLFEERIRCT